MIIYLKRKNRSTSAEYGVLTITDQDDRRVRSLAAATWHRSDPRALTTNQQSGWFDKQMLQMNEANQKGAEIGTTYNSCITGNHDVGGYLRRARLGFNHNERPQSMQLCKYEWLIHQWLVECNL